MAFNKKFFTTGGIVASTPSVAAFDPLQNFETVAYTGNGGTQKITGYIRKGAAFNGSSSKVILPESTTSSIDSNGAFSVSFWFFANSGSLGSTERRMITLFDGIYIWIEIPTNENLRYRVANSSSTNIENTGTTTITENAWHHIVLTGDSSNGIIAYLDGSVEISPASWNGTFKNGSGASRYDYNVIGGQEDDLGSLIRPFLGKIDQVRFFNTALNLTQVGQLADEEYGDAKNSTKDFFGNGSGVALYQLDENANDTGVPIDSGQSAVFNGSNSVIDFSQPLLINTFSVSFWINSTSTASQRILGNPYGGAGDYGWNIRIEATTGHLEVEWSANGTNPIILDTATSVIDGNWHHIVATWDEGSQKIYIDNVPEASSTNASDQYATTDTFKIGANWNNTAHYNGKLDQVRIYNTALGSGDVTNLYNESNVPSANLVAHYKLDGNGNDETTNNNATSVSNITYSDPAKREHNGTPTNVNFLGMAFKPDLVWIKNRDTTSVGTIHDTINGAGYYVIPSTTNGLSTLQTDVFSSFDSNGFTVGTSSATNGNTNDIVAWCWKAADTTTTIAANTVGNTIASDVRANTAAGFSIVKFTGNNASSATIAHGLNSPPEMIIQKRLDSTSGWATYHYALGATKALFLNTDSTPSTSAGFWNNTAPTSTVMSIENLPVSPYVHYCFHSVDGYQKVGTYEGNGTSKSISELGFQPRFVLIKSVDAAKDWFIFDSVRTASQYLRANTNDVEATSSGALTSFDSDGFSIGNSGAINTNQDTHIYLAIA